MYIKTNKKVVLNHSIVFLQTCRGILFVNTGSSLIREPVIKCCVKVRDDSSS